MNILTAHCRPVKQVYYHGSATAAGIKHLLLPPETTETISEKGRKKNLNRVFITEDLGLAIIYSGRAARSIGGKPIVYRVVQPVDIQTLSDAKGATVYHASWAFCERVL